MLLKVWPCWGAFRVAMLGLCREAVLGLLGRLSCCGAGGCVVLLCWGCWGSCRAAVLGLCRAAVLGLCRAAVLGLLGRLSCARGTCRLGTRFYHVSSCIWISLRALAPTSSSSFLRCFTSAVLFGRGLVLKVVCGQG